MKVARIHQTGGPEQIRIDELATPEPKPGQVRVRVQAAGVNFIDIYHRSGQYQVPLPFALGQEGAGTVEAVGEGVHEFRVGEAVAWVHHGGSYATHAIIPAEKLVRIPSGISVQQAAAVMLQGMTAHYLCHSTYPIRPGETCLIHAAAGGVGLLLTQMVKMRGGKVIGTVSSARKAELARAAGADEVIVYTEKDFVAEVKALTQGQLVHVVYDGVGKDVFDKNLLCLRRRGYEVLFGQSSGAVAPVDPQVLSQRGSLFLTRPALQHYIHDRDELSWRSGDLFQWIREGKLSVRIDRTFPLEEAAEAHRALASRQTSGKLLLIP